MTRKSPNLIPLPTAKTPAAPAHLQEPEERLWAELTASHQFDDPASLALLRTALESHQRARRCREQIDRDGEAVRDKWNQIKCHPLLAAERDARASFLSAMRLLNLDVAS